MLEFATTGCNCHSGGSITNSRNVNSLFFLSFIKTISPSLGVASLSKIKRVPCGNRGNIDGRLSNAKALGLIFSFSLKYTDCHSFHIAKLISRRDEILLGVSQFNFGTKSERAFPKLLLATRLPFSIKESIETPK